MDRAQPTYADIEDALSSRLSPAGFDLLGAVSIGVYNRALGPEQHEYRLSELHGARDVAFVIGSTRKIWPLFIHAYATTSVGEEPHPFDNYTRRCVGNAAAAVANEFGVRQAVRYSFDRAPEAVAIQRLATFSGAAELGPIGLCVHPTHGPWFSLRAAVVFDVPGPPARTPRPTCSECAERPCLVARDDMLRTSKGVLDPSTFHVHWRSWLAMRDACPLGAEARYGDDQVRYHYLKERSILDAAARSAWRSNSNDDG